MDGCFVPCGCDDYEGITKSDLDRYTDKIENVINDDKGRKLFRNFMFTSKMRDGRKALDFIEQTDRLLGYKETAESVSYPTYLKEIDCLIDKAERIEELDLATMERLTIARDSENKEEIIEILKILRVEAIKALRKEYSRFREHFIANRK